MAYQFKKFQSSDALKEEEKKKNEYVGKVENYGEYKPDEATTNANKLWNQYQNAVENYGDFAYGRQEAYDKLLDQILNRKDFSYDLNGDALYQQYKDKFINQGKMASMDVMGQASAMTGGYGNSYASTAGNQAYQASLQNLNDVVPQLYSLAYDKYNQEGQNLINQFGVVSGDRNQQYGEWNDALNKLISQRAYYGDTYFNLDSKGQAEHQAGYDKALEMLNYYNQSANNLYNREYGEFTDTENKEYQEYWNDKNFNKSNKSSGGGSVVSTVDNGSLTTAQVKAVQTALGVSADGKAGPKTQAALIAAGFTSIDDAYKKLENGLYSQFFGDDSASKITPEIEKKASSFKSNIELASYLDGLEKNGTISSEDADNLYAKFMDKNEKFKPNSTDYSYTDMVNSASGWKTIDNGGINWFGIGIDANAVVEAPNGQPMRLDELREKLKAEGKTSSQATEIIKKLQKELGI
jgi:hypothetical protein